MYNANLATRLYFSDVLLCLQISFMYHYVIDGGTTIVECGGRSKPGVNVSCTFG